MQSAPLDIQLICMFKGVFYAQARAKDVCRYGGAQAAGRVGEDDSLLDLERV